MVERIPIGGNMKRQLLLILGMGLWVLTMFQNCGPNPIQFGSDLGLTKIVVNDDDLASPDSNPVETIIDNTGGASSNGSNIQNENARGSGGISTPVASNDGTSPSGSNSINQPSDENEEVVNEEVDDHEDVAQESEDDEKGESCRGDDGHKHKHGKKHRHRGRHFICVLEGNGQSHAVGFNDGVLEGQVGTPKVVCMSKYSCENIISKKFAVKGAVHKGYCPRKNKHVIPLNRREIRELISKLN